MQTLLFFAGTLSLSALALVHLWLRRMLRRRAPPPSLQRGASNPLSPSAVEGRPSALPSPASGRVAPSVTVIRPIRGLDVGAEENVRALLGLDYPGELELLFVFDSEADPAFPLVSRCIERHPTRARRASMLVAGTPPPGVTGKLNAMLEGVREANGQLIAFSDSDTRPTPTILSSLVAALMADARAGASFSTIHAGSDLPGPGDLAYQLLVNAWYSPSVVSAQRADGSTPFIMGQLMVFRPEALASIGGVGAAAGQFVDDMYLGRRLSEQGWRNVVVHAPLLVVTGEMSLGSFLRTFRRWMVFAQAGLSLRSTWAAWVRGAACWLGWLSLFASLGARAWPSALMSAAAIFFSTWDQVELQRLCHGGTLRFRQLWIPAVLPLLAAVAAVASRAARDVDWRGRSYALTASARLDEALAKNAG
jgi:ceramide glucosyltransferase